MNYQNYLQEIKIHCTIDKQENDTEIKQNIFIGGNSTELVNHKLLMKIFMKLYVLSPKHGNFHKQNLNLTILITS